MKCRDQTTNVGAWIQRKQCNLSIRFSLEVKLLQFSFTYRRIDRNITCRNICRNYKSEAVGDSEQGYHRTYVVGILLGGHALMLYKFVHASFFVIGLGW